METFLFSLGFKPMDDLFSLFKAAGLLISL